MVKNSVGCDQIEPLIVVVHHDSVRAKGKITESDDMDICMYIEWQIVVFFTFVLEGAICKRNGRDRTRASLGIGEEDEKVSKYFTALHRPSSFVLLQ